MPFLIVCIRVKCGHYLGYRAKATSDTQVKLSPSVDHLIIATPLDQSLQCSERSPGAAARRANDEAGCRLVGRCGPRQVDAFFARTTFSSTPFICIDRPSGSARSSPRRTCARITITQGRCRCTASAVTPAARRVDPYGRRRGPCRSSLLWNILIGQQLELAQPVAHPGEHLYRVRVGRAFGRSGQRRRSRPPSRPPTRHHPLRSHPRRIARRATGTDLDLTGCRARRNKCIQQFHNPTLNADGEKHISVIADGVVFVLIARFTRMKKGASLFIGTSRGGATHSGAGRCRHPSPTRSPDPQDTERPHRLEVLRLREDQLRRRSLPSRS